MSAFSHRDLLRQWDYSPSNDRHSMVFALPTKGRCWEICLSLLHTCEHRSHRDHFRCHGYWALSKYLCQYTKVCRKIAETNIITMLQNHFLLQAVQFDKSITDVYVENVVLILNIPFFDWATCSIVLHIVHDYALWTKSSVVLKKNVAYILKKMLSWAKKLWISIR